MALDRLSLDGSLLTCVKTSKTGKCLQYLQTCDGGDCISESPAHPQKPGARKKKTPAKKRKRTAPAGKKEPWQMTAEEWKSAVNATHPGFVRSKPTKASGSQAARKIAEHERLNYDAYIYNRDLKQGVVNHKLVIAKAFLEGQRIPQKVLAEYPDIKSYANSAGYKKHRGEILAIKKRHEDNKAAARAEKDRLKIDMVYKMDVAKAIKQIQADNPGGTDRDYFVHKKSPQRSYVEQFTPVQGKSYAKVLRHNMGVHYYNAKHELVQKPPKTLIPQQSPLSGALLTCNRWIMVGKGENQVIRCGSFKRTCLPGDAECAGEKPEKKAKKPPKKKGKDPLEYLRHQATTFEPSMPMAEDRFVNTYRTWYITPTGGKVRERDLSLLTAARRTTPNRWTEAQKAALVKYKIQDPFEAMPGQEFIKKHGYSDLAEFWRDTHGKQAKKPPPVKEPTKSDKEVLEKRILETIKDESLTIDRVADRALLDPDFVITIVNKLADENKVMINETKGGIVVITPKGKSVIGIEKEPMSEEGVAPWMKKEPFTAAQTKAYQEHIHNKNYDINAEFVKNVDYRQGEIDQMMNSRNVEEVPWEVSRDFMNYKRQYYHLVNAIPTASEGERERLRNEALKADNALTKSITNIRKSTKPPTPEPEPAAAPKIDIWMKERPFTKEDTNRYNAFTFHPIKDLNDDFVGMMKPKLEEVDRRMKKYGLKEIPAEVQTGLQWYRRRVYEYLQRMIYSRLNAPGSFVVGPSKYNVKKHNKVIAGDEKYREALNVSGRKLDTAINKHIARTETGRKAVSVHDREKWEAIAVKTKRTAFGKKVLEDYLEQAKTDPKVAATAKSLNLENPKSTFRSVLRAEARNLHSRLVEDAFKRGDYVAPEVRNEYPDLYRPEIDLVKLDKAKWSHSKWLKWETTKPPVILNPGHRIPADKAYLVQDRSQRKSTEKGWDYSVVEGTPIKFTGAEDVPLIVHLSTKEPGTYDITHVPSGALMAAQSNPLDSNTKAVTSVKDWIERDAEGFRQSIEKTSQRRLTSHYPHLTDLFHELNLAKTGKRRSIMADRIKRGENLSGAGSLLSAANAIYSLARVVGGV